ELYVVMRGRAKFTVGEETAVAGVGTIVYVPPQVFRTAVAEEDGTIVLAAGGIIGHPFHGGDWGTFAGADELRPSGRVGQGRGGRFCARHARSGPTHGRWRTTQAAGRCSPATRTRPSST